MNGFVALHLRRLREHPGRAALSAGGIGVGIALMVAMLGLFGSLTSGVDRVTDLSGGANLEVSAANDGGFDAALVDEVAAVRGVRVAAPLIRSQVGVRRVPTLLLGFDRRSRALGRNAVLAPCVPKHLPERPGIILGPAFSDARRLTLTSSLGSAAVDVLTRVDCGPARRVNAGRFVMAPLELAQRLAGKPGRVDTVEIVAAPHTPLPALTQRVEQVVAGRAVVASPRLLAQQARTNSQAFQQAATIMVVLAVVVGSFCVFNTVSITALERRRELATLRAVGGSRRRLLLGFLFEMTILGAVGSAAGAGIGYALGSRLIGAIPPLFVDQIGIRPTFQVDRGLIVSALLVGTLATIAASLAPARAATAVAPVEAMRPEGPAEASMQVAGNSTAATLGGVAFLVAGTLVAIAGSKNATVAGFGAIAAAVLVITFGQRGNIARAVAFVAALFGGSGRLAAASIERAPRRTWATVAAVTIAVATVVAVGAIADNLLYTYRRPFEPMKRPDLWITTGPVGALPVSLRFDEDFAPRLEKAVPWISKTIGSQFSYTTVGSNRVLVEGLAAGTTQPMLAAMPPRRGSALFDDPRPAVIVNAAFADTNHVHVGSRIRLTTEIGTKAVTVIGIVNVPSPSATGRIAMDRRLVKRFFGQTGVSFVEVYGKNGVTPQQLRRLVAAALRTSPTRAYVATGVEEYQGVVSSLRQSTAIFEAMRVAVLLATALALANAMLISVVERGRELGIVRAVGTSRRQLRRMVVIESVSIVIVGSVIGTLNGLLQHRVGVKTIGTLLKTTIDFRFVGSPIVGALAAMAVTAVVAAIVPAARAANINVIEAIGYE